jgi:DNA-directed RNA polymerase sigma subunit (sigma70/sigma32)
MNTFDIDKFSEALNELNPCDREFLELRYVDKLTLREIGVRVRLSRERCRQKINLAARRLSRIVDRLNQIDSEFDGYDLSSIAPHALLVKKLTEKP